MAVVDISNFGALVRGFPPFLCVQVLRGLVELPQGALAILDSKHLPVVHDRMQHCNCSTGIAQALYLSGQGAT